MSSPFTEWSTNNLILNDPALRKRAGVTVLDNDVSEILHASVAVTPKQKGGAASGAPLHVSHYGGKNARDYDSILNNQPDAWNIQPMPKHKPATKQQCGGANFPFHYYANNQRF